MCRLDCLAADSRLPHVRVSSALPHGGVATHRPGFYDEMRRLPGCDALDARGMLKFFMGHTHCNVRAAQGAREAGWLASSCASNTDPPRVGLACGRPIQCVLLVWPALPRGGHCPWACQHARHHACCAMGRCHIRTAISIPASWWRARAWRAVATTVFRSSTRPRAACECGTLRYSPRYARLRVQRLIGLSRVTCAKS